MKKNNGLAFGLELQKIGAKAVKEVERKSLENSFADVYSKNGQIYFQLPGGAITQEILREYKKVGSEKT